MIKSSNTAAVASGGDSGETAEHFSSWTPSEDKRPSDQMTSLVSTDLTLRCVDFAYTAAEASITEC